MFGDTAGLGIGEERFADEGVDDRLEHRLQ